jgi:hypothetical protein
MRATDGSDITPSSLVNPQLELGSNANSYTPFGTAPIELCKIGNYQDYIYKDSDKWYLHKEIGKVVLNGSESWFKSGVTTIDRFFIDLYSGTNYGKYNSLSNYFVWENNATTNVGTFYFAYNSSTDTSRMFINYSTYNTTTLNNFKTWLSTHNTEIYYILLTPTNTEITYQPLIEQLNALSSQ